MSISEGLVENNTTVNLQSLHFYLFIYFILDTNCLDHAETLKLLKGSVETCCPCSTEAILLNN